MATQRVLPKFGDADTWRDIVRNNERIHHIEVVLSSNETWLPLILVASEFFPSTSQVRKNRPDLWRDREPFDHISLQWAQIEIWP